MGIVRAETTGEELVLEANHLVGRSEHCTLQIRDAHVSAEHASIRWDGTRWLLRDLGSRNFTWLDGQPLSPSVTVALKTGSRIAFGDLRTAYTLVDAEAPKTLAEGLDGNARIFAESGLLVLPSHERPLVTVYRNADGEWVLDNGRSIECARHRAIIEVAGAHYRLFLGQAVAETTPIHAGVGRTVANTCLDFRVSREEEHIELHVRLHGEVHDFGARTHNYLLLFLARQRLADIAAMEPPTACGWVFQEEVCDALRVDPERLNVDVYRVRQQLATINLSDPGEIIQRRPRTRQLRLGTHCCTIASI